MKMFVMFVVGFKDAASNLHYVEYFGFAGISISPQLK
jgi:hypothetical protein